MSNSIYKELREIESIADIIGTIFENVCYKHIDYYIENKEPRLSADELNELNTELKKQSWDRYPIIKEIDLNVIELDETSTTKYISYAKTEISWLIHNLKSRCEASKWDTELNLAQKNLNEQLITDSFLIHTFFIEKSSFRTFFTYIHGILNELDNIIIYLDDKLPQPDINSTPYSNAVAHKILLLHELGIIDFLKDRFFSLDQNLRTGTDMANMIATIINESNSGTVRKAIDGLTSKSKSNIITTTGIRKVKSYLAKFGIDLRKLRDPD